MTLNGKPAIISNLDKKFVLVRSLDGTLSVEFSRGAAERILAYNNGQFLS